jgi:squalene-hopene/tetraprenyl-beta-curcumene cyclase
MRHVSTVLVLVVLIAFGALASEVTAKDTTNNNTAKIGPDPKTYQQTVTRGIDFLGNRGQAEDGTYSKKTGIGVTGLAATAILRHGRSPEDPIVARSLSHLRGSVQPDGGIYMRGTFLRNYETCLAILCFHEANRNGQYDKLIAGGDKFLKGLQWDENEDKEISDLSYGGGGYGKHERPDLSNTSYLIEALKTSGNGPESDAMRKALIFISRCQNLETEHNTTPYASKNPDGSFYYTCAAGGDSKSGELANGGLRGYGSMTYAGLKSMIYAGVDKNDPRVKAAYAWIEKNYSLKQNPGLGTAGLFYYYHTLAKTLDAMEVDYVVDANGVKHDWRRELTAELAARQRPDGSWINENSRWLEGDPNLVTAYALLALSYCR